MKNINTSKNLIYYSLNNDNCISLITSFFLLEENSEFEDKYDEIKD